MKIDYQNLYYIHPTLRQLMNWLEMRYGVEFTITSQYRTTGGIHNTIPLRAHDLRMWNEEMGQMIMSHINSNWMYDRSRPELNVCEFHDNASGTGKHLHLQVHQNTEKLQ